MNEPRRDQAADSSWATVVAILLVIIAILLIGYFAWWAPSRQSVTVIRTPEEAPAQPAPSGPPSAPDEGSTPRGEPPVTPGATQPRGSR